MVQNFSDLNHFTFTMDEEDWVFVLLNAPESPDYNHLPGVKLKRILKSAFWNALEWLKWNNFAFTMAEENFKILIS